MPFTYGMAFCTCGESTATTPQVPFPLSGTKRLTAIFSGNHESRNVADAASGLHNSTASSTLNGPCSECTPVVDWNIVHLPNTRRLMLKACSVFLFGLQEQGDYSRSAKNINLNVERWHGGVHHYLSILQRASDRSVAGPLLNRVGA